MDTQELQSALQGGLSAEEARGIILRQVRPSEIFAPYTELKARGNKVKGLCPLHKEKSPSLEVDDEKGLWYCHGCKAGGDVFTATELLENTTFAGALRLLSERVGVHLQEKLRRMTGTVHDRVSGAGTLDSGEQVTFVLGPDRLPSGTLEQAQEDDGLLYGPQLWDERGGEWRAQGVLLILDTPEQVRRAVAAGLPGGCLIGKDGVAMAQMAERWGLRRAVISARSLPLARARVLALPRGLSQGSGMNQGLILMGLTHEQLRRGLDEATLDQAAQGGLAFDEQDDLAARELAGHVEERNSREVAWALTRLRARARDRDLFHPTPMRLQSRVRARTGLSSAFLERAMRERGPVDPIMVARALGWPVSDMRDLRLAAGLWRLSAEHAPRALAARVRRWLDPEQPVHWQLPERSLQLLEALERAGSAPAGQELRLSRRLLTELRSAPQEPPAEAVRSGLDHYATQARAARKRAAQLAREESTLPGAPDPLAESRAGGEAGSGPDNGPNSEPAREAEAPRAD